VLFVRPAARRAGRIVLPNRRQVAAIQHDRRHAASGTGFRPFRKRGEPSTELNVAR
jgi:hypothetical protein